MLIAKQCLPSMTLVSRENSLEQLIKRTNVSFSSLTTLFHSQMMKKNLSVQRWKTRRWFFTIFSFCFFFFWRRRQIFLFLIRFLLMIFTQTCKTFITSLFSVQVHPYILTVCTHYELIKRCEMRLNSCNLFHSLITEH